MASAFVMCKGCGAHLFSLTPAMIKACGQAGFRALKDQIDKRRGKLGSWVRGGFCPYCKKAWYSKGEMTVSVPRAVKPEEKEPDWTPTTFDVRDNIRGEQDAD